MNNNAIGKLRQRIIDSGYTGIGVMLHGEADYIIHWATEKVHPCFILTVRGVGDFYSVPVHNPDALFELLLDESKPEWKLTE